MDFFFLFKLIFTRSVIDFIMYTRIYKYIYIYVYTRRTERRNKYIYILYKIINFSRPSKRGVKSLETISHADKLQVKRSACFGLFIPRIYTGCFHGDSTNAINLVRFDIIQYSFFFL